MTGSRDADLSRLVSHALRHEPWLYELELDDEGWVGVEELLDAVNRRPRGTGPVERADLERMLATASKQRHELDGDRIRALYGHSVPGRIRREPAVAPPRLFHGTSPQAWEEIRTIGLRPMRRQSVHLSVDRETALAVGSRKSDRPLLLVVDTDVARAAGTTFERGNERVWLADRITPDALRPDDEVAPADAGSR